MKANKVLEKLNISRKTLSIYVKLGKIRASLQQNGRYEYNEDDVNMIEKNQTSKNRILVFKNNRKIEFKLSSDQINSILTYIISLN